MKQLVLQTRCDSLTANSIAAINGTESGSLLDAILRGCAFMNDTDIPVYVDIREPDNKSSEEPDSGAVLYIVAVLVFYSAGIVIMMVKYLKREKQELEEEKTLDDFFRSVPVYKREREQNKVNRVAIHAFHALTSYSYDDNGEESDTSDETFRVLSPTIHEHSEDCDEAIDLDTTDEIVPETYVQNETELESKDRTISP